MTGAINQNKAPELELDEDLGYGKLLSIIIRRRNWFLVILAVALSFSTVSALNQEPEYQSSFQLLIDTIYRNTESSATKNVYEDLNVEVENYATQLEIMRSSQLLAKAADLLSSEYPDLDGGDIGSSFEIYQVEGDDYAEDRVKTTVFEAKYTDEDPLKTKRVSEAIIKVYQNHTLEQQRERLAQGLSFINAQLPIARRRVTEAENALENFRKTHNLVNPEQKGNSIEEELKDIRTQKRQVKIEYQNALAQYNAWQNQLERSPQKASVAARLSQSSRYTNLLEEMQKVELALNARQSRFKDRDPGIQNLQEELAEKRSLLKTEAQNILGFLPADLELTSNLIKEGQLGENDLNREELLANLENQLNSLQAKERGLEVAEQNLQAELDLFPSLIAEYNRLRPEVDVRRATVQQLLSARQKLSIEIDRGGLRWQVVEAPDFGSDVTPSKLKTLLAGAVVGSFLGIGVAFGREMLDDTVHTPQQLEQESARTLLGVIPELPAENLNQQNSELLLNQFRDPERSIEQAIYLRPLRESLDLIYQNIIHIAGKNKSFLVTSIEPEADRLALMLGLASSASRSNQKVLLIDTNFRFPSLHEKFNLANDRGLSNLLMGEITNVNIQSVSLLEEEIDVLTAGSNVGDPIKLLSSPRLKELMFAFERNYDLVLLNSPPVLAHVDVLRTSRCCQGVVLMAKINHITKSKLTEANSILSQLNVVGIVADGGEASDAKLHQIYEPQWESMFKQLPPANVS